MKSEFTLNFIARALKAQFSKGGGVMTVLPQSENSLSTTSREHRLSSVAAKAPMIRTRSLPAVSQQVLLPLVRPIAALTIALAAEYTLRTLVNRTVSTLARPVIRALPDRMTMAMKRPQNTRTIVTELLVIEPARHRD